MWQMMHIGLAIARIVNGIHFGLDANLFIFMQNLLFFSIQCFYRERKSEREKRHTIDFNSVRRKLEYIWIKLSYVLTIDWIMTSKFNHWLQSTENVDICLCIVIWFDAGLENQSLTFPKLETIKSKQSLNVDSVAIAQRILPNFSTGWKTRTHTLFIACIQIWYFLCL